LATALPGIAGVGGHQAQLAEIGFRAPKQPPALVGTACPGHGFGNGGICAADETTVAQGKTEKEMAHQNLPKYLAVITYTFRAA